MMLAVPRSSVDTRFGRAAIEAGSKIAPSAVIVPARTYTSHTWEASWMKKNPSARIPRITSAVIINIWRFSRSASGPPTNVKRANGTESGSTSIMMRG